MILIRTCNQPCWQIATKITLRHWLQSSIIKWNHKHDSFFSQQFPQARRILHQHASCGINHWSPFTVVRLIPVAISKSIGLAIDAPTSRLSENSNNQWLIINQFFCFSSTLVWQGYPTSSSTRINVGSLLTTRSITLAMLLASISDLSN